MHVPSRNRPRRLNEREAGCWSASPGIAVGKSRVIDLARMTVFLAIPLMRPQFLFGYPLPR
jgi:hypothetical protein